MSTIPAEIDSRINHKNETLEKELHIINQSPRGEILKSTTQELQKSAARNITKALFISISSLLSYGRFLDSLRPQTLIRDIIKGHTWSTNES